MEKYRKLKSILAAFMVMFMSCSVVSCDNQVQSTVNTENLDLATKELRQSDYRGGVVRTKVLQNNVISTMEEMKANNITIRQTSPNSFWTTDGYQDFVSTFLDVDIIDDTQWFNEELASWDETVTYMAGLSSSFALDGKFINGVSVVRNEKDDYSVKEVPKTYQIDGTAVSADGEEYSYSCISAGKAKYRILYDCDKDWCKSYATMVLEDTKLPPVTIELFEYQRIDDNTFAIQTNRERLLVILEKVDADTDIRDRKVKEFYYSKIIPDGRRTTYKPYEFLPEQDLRTGMAITSNIKKNELMTEYPFVNESGDLCNSYGESDSMFFYDPVLINQSWVFEDKSLQQAIVYKDGALVVTTYNKLSANYERFVYSRVGLEEKLITELEDMVEINNLVGEQDTEVTVASGEKKDTAQVNSAVSGDDTVVTTKNVSGTDSVQTTLDVSAAEVTTIGSAEKNSVTENTSVATETGLTEKMGD